MEMTKDRYAEVRLNMRRILDAHPTLVRLAKERGHSDARVAWDIFWATRYNVATLYGDGLNDSHIETALLKTIREVQS